jgi:hypothetical protein
MKYTLIFISLIFLQSCNSTLIKKDKSKSDSLLITLVNTQLDSSSCKLCAESIFVIQSLNKTTGYILMSDTKYNLPIIIKYIKGLENTNIPENFNEKLDTVKLKLYDTIKVRYDYAIQDDSMIFNFKIFDSTFTENACTNYKVKLNCNKYGLPIIGL